MRWSNVQTNECDLQAEKYLIICTHHKLRTNDENKTQFPGMYMAGIYQTL